MFWFIGLVIIAVLVKFFIDRENMLVKQVDAYGGLRNKYAVFLNEFKDLPNFRIIKENRIQLIFTFNSQTVHNTLVISENFNAVNISWEGNLGHFGKDAATWEFPSHLSQQVLFEKVSNQIAYRMQKRMAQFYGQ